MRKKGSSVIGMPIAISIATISLIAIFVCMVNFIVPFSIYQKIDNVATKYIYVIEKFGFLTENEKNNLLSDLNNKGISSNYVTLEYPSFKEPYGNLVTLKISYRYVFNMPRIMNNKIISNKKETVISIEKNSFSKIY